MTPLSLGKGILSSRQGLVRVACTPQSPSRPIGNLANLESWQVDELEAAYVRGRRTTKISKLSVAVGLSRDQVLAWFKDFETIPENARQSILSSLESKKSTDEELQERIGAIRASKALKKRASVEHKGVRADPTKKELKPLTRVKLEVLRKLSETTSRPTKATLRSLTELHQIPQKQALDWFKKLRRKRRKRVSKV